jgi:hypothetical protein
MKLQDIFENTGATPLSRMTPAEYVLHTYYVYGGNDETDITIEDSRQKYRILISGSHVDVIPDDSINNRRAREIRRDILARTDFGQLDSDVE